MSRQDSRRKRAEREERKLQSAQRQLQTLREIDASPRIIAAAEAYVQSLRVDATQPGQRAILHQFRATSRHHPFTDGVKSRAGSWNLPRAEMHP